MLAFWALQLIALVAYGLVGMIAWQALIRRVRVRIDRWLFATSLMLCPFMVYLTCWLIERSLC